MDELKFLEFFKATKVFDTGYTKPISDFRVETGTGTKKIEYRPITSYYPPPLLSTLLRLATLYV